MTRNFLLLCAAFLAATAFACAPALAPPPLVGGGPSALSWPLASCDPDSFANAVQMARPFPLLTNITPVSDGPVQPNMRADLRGAFAMAPPFFQRRLCGLDGVFVSENAESWGFRNVNDRKQYVGVTKDLWNGNAPAIPYAAFENGILKALLRGWPGPQHPPGGPNPAESARTVLAALAHEYGHVLWYVTYVPMPGGPAHFENFCSDGTSNFYTGPLGSWVNTVGEPPPSMSPPSRWRFFGDVAGTHKTGDDLDGLLASIPPPGTPDTHGAGKKLRGLYARPGVGATGRWAGLFAAFSPQEDFVETFKLFVLRKAAAPLQSLPIDIPIGAGRATEDIPATCSSRPALQRKLACFQSSLCGDPAADPCGFTCAVRP